MWILIFIAISLILFDQFLNRYFLDSFTNLEESKKYLPYYMDPRIIYSLQSALLFFIIASPQVYAITGKLFATKGTPLLIIHSVVFAVVVYALMIINV
jgi:hypothetical protein